MHCGQVPKEPTDTTSPLHSIFPLSPCPPLCILRVLPLLVRTAQTAHNGVSATSASRTAGEKSQSSLWAPAPTTLTRLKRARTHITNGWPRGDWRPQTPSMSWTHAQGARTHTSTHTHGALQPELRGHLEILCPLPPPKKYTTYSRLCECAPLNTHIVWEGGHLRALLCVPHTQSCVWGHFPHA